ncbi:gibberellin 2-beta-dioxygenase 8 isoform X2 [Syzygium oleosum]|uniref:gibberellin 2-beta-dioxygenase 8 isoform X2 n=1 Tax=Syzygium oleosum TaxID=219896 RepID=UPI0024BB7AF0|nr:gibberellin 2-beta-dioxygenase 8 isoform X2 [Syzygium oleosum]
MVKVVNLVENLSHPLTMDSSDPPFQETYKTLFKKLPNKAPTAPVAAVEERDLPVIDLGRLSLGEEERRGCKLEIARASREWGFFQVLNHGISREILEKMREEQIKVFREPFEKKTREDKYLNFSAGSYRWGTPSATCLRQLSWSEAFHVPLSDIISGTRGCNSTLSSTMEKFAGTVSNLAQRLAEILAEELGHKSTFFMENCLPSTCYLRMNRYPPCPISPDVFGLMPHTDSDFLTILHQDEVGGLQLVKDGEWIAVKPNSDALIINIGDLFQAWSNDVYKSVQHRVATNSKWERYSTAYFLCPSYDTVIESCNCPPVYRSFSFREFRRQVQEDVQTLGLKVGLPRFLV